jgi:hypothetical protein
VDVVSTRRRRIRKKKGKDEKKIDMSAVEWESTKGVTKKWKKWKQNKNKKRTQRYFIMTAPDQKTWLIAGCLPIFLDGTVWSSSFFSPFSFVFFLIVFAEYFINI